MADAVTHFLCLNLVTAKAIYKQVDMFEAPDMRQDLSSLWCKGPQIWPGGKRCQTPSFLS